MSTQATFEQDALDACESGVGEGWAWSWDFGYSSNGEVPPLYLQRSCESWNSIFYWQYWGVFTLQQQPNPTVSTEVKWGAKISVSHSLQLAWYQQGTGEEPKNHPDPSPIKSAFLSRPLNESHSQCGLLSSSAPLLISCCQSVSGKDQKQKVWVGTWH